MVRFKFFTLVAFMLLGGCASNKYLGHPGHKLFKAEAYQQAADSFEASAQKPGTNQVLFLLDAGMSHFQNREYDKAIEIFLRAEDLAEIKDYTSVSEEVGVLVTGQDVRGYKGEDFEKLMINAYLALAFAAKGEMESAQVECRKINLLINRMVTDGKRNYEESTFARYISALLWEASGEYNSAFIDYKKVFEQDPSYPNLIPYMIRAAKLAGLHDEVRRIRSEHANVKLLREGRDAAELVVFIERGRAPAKKPQIQDATLPRLVSHPLPSYQMKLFVGDKEKTNFNLALDVDGLSKEFLADRLERLKLSRLAATATKAAIAVGAGALADNEDVGWLAFFLLAASDRADLRSWRSLPAEIHLLRAFVEPGTYPVELHFLNASGESRRVIDFGEVTIEARKTRVLVGR